MITTRTNLNCILAAGLAVILFAASLQAQDTKDPKAAIVEEVRNDQPAFLVRVNVDHASRVYGEGDTMKVTVRSERSGYLYLVYCQADGKVSVLFPNKFQTDNRIEADRDIVVPATNARFRIRIGKPLGDEVLKAIVTLNPLKQLDADSFTKSVVTDIKYSNVRSAYIEECKPNPSRWAEHHVKIKTVPAAAVGAAVAVKPRRIGVFIGISDYQDSNIRGLRICHLDAREMARVMRARGEIDQSFVLVNQQATLRKIEETIRKRVTKLTRPGDEVIIYWSGHGARVADENGDEKDGLDELLVPYDANTENIDTVKATMLSDDTFGRWIQELDGRRIAVILDTCHSAGQATNEKSLRDGAKGLPMMFGKAIRGVELDFFDGEFARTKDIGQKGAAILASSQAAQISFVRREEDLSAMTYFLVKLIEKNDGPVTLATAFKHLQKELPAYVERRFPGTTQTPVLVDDITPPLYLSPQR